MRYVEGWERTNPQGRLIQYPPSRTCGEAGETMLWYITEARRAKSDFYFTRSGKWRRRGLRYKTELRVK